MLAVLTLVSISPYDSLDEMPDEFDDVLNISLIFLSCLRLNTHSTDNHDLLIEEREREGERRWRSA